MSAIWVAVWVRNRIAALVGAANLVALLILASRILLPREPARELMAWISGNKTLDSASAGL